MSLEGLGPLRFSRAAHLRKDLAFLEGELRRDETLILPLWRDFNLVDEGRLVFLPLREAGDLLDGGGELVWLGQIDGVSCFALDVSALLEPRAHPALRTFQFHDLRLIGATLSLAHAGLAAYARGILYWHSRHRYCGICGGTTAAREGGHVRACRDEACGAQHFPRTDPAIIVLVQDGDRCLLGRQRSWPSGMYSTLAGFVEPGETMEEAVAREVEEEAGILVEDVRYFRSQPWPFPSSLMIGFMARATTYEIHLGDAELEDAAWFTRAELREPPVQGFFVPGTFSLAGRLIASFLAA